jgi:hypothetical protein
MEKRVQIISALVAGILVLLAGCSNVLESPGKAPVPGGKGRVEIRVEDAVRTALPPETFDTYTLRFAYTGTEGYIHGDVEWDSGTVSIDLEPGIWTVYVDAYIGGTVSGTGSAEVTVSAGTVTPVTIRVKINTAAPVKGTLTYTVSYPDTGHTYEPVTLTVRGASGNAVDDSVPITNGVEGSLELDPGVYFVGVVITDTELRIGVARTSVAHIYGEKETSLTFTIEEEDFIALVPITVTANLTVSDGIAVDRRLIAAYGDEACTTTLLTSGPVDSAGRAEITLWTPSADEVVYVRQEIQVGATMFNGKSVLVTIANPEQPAEESLADSFYKVITSGLIDGAVTAAPIALSGSSVDFTVTPATNYILKSGTLKCNDGTISITGTGDPNYAFTMPASDVTISAFFNRVLGFTIELPTDKATAVTITMAHSEGADPATEISWSGNESILFTVEGSDYTVEDGNLQWIVNGTEISDATGNSHTIRARRYVKRSYTITVMIEEDGQWYSREIPFKVTE